MCTLLAAGAGFARAQVAGTVDPSFSGGTTFNSDPQSVVVQDNGKIVIGGAFETIDGQARNRMARLLPNGVLEDLSTFNPGNSFATYSVQCLAGLPDGKVLAGGYFMLSRLLPDGSVDPSFNSGATIAYDGSSTLYCIAVQADGKILIGGEFTTVDHQSRNGIARLLPDGSVESTATFNAGTGADGGSIHSMALQEDGKIIIVGEFTSINGQPRRNIARLNPDGTLESTATFQALPGFSGPVSIVALQADGKILAGGYGFSAVHGQSRHGIVRLNADGSLEDTFNPGNIDAPMSIVVQTDGKILAGGYSFVRLLPGGLPEPVASFNPAAGSGTRINGIALRPDGKIVLAGSNMIFNGQPKRWLAQLTNDPAAQSLAVSGTSTVTWNRSGSAPEVGQVTFALSTDTGVTWTPLGRGSRIPGGWQLNGPTLPHTGLLRAQGRVSGGNRNESSGVTELVAPFTLTENTAPEISLEQPAFSVLSTGGNRDFGMVQTGDTAELSFVIRNTGTAPLTGIGLSLSGPDASQFTLVSTPPVSVQTGTEALLKVRFSPVSSGLKNAILRLGSNDADEETIDITLTGSGSLLPIAEITVREPNGPSIVSGETRDLGTLPVGTPGGMQVNITNEGVGNLTGLQATIDGPDSDMFSLTTAPESPLGPGGGTRLHVRFLPSRGGAISATLHIASNDRDENPFDIKLTGYGTGIDPSFILPVLDGDIGSVVVLPSGKLLVGGGFTTAGGASHRYIARLEKDGALDPSFTYGAAGRVEFLSVLPDGRIVIGTEAGIERILENGTPDPSFTSPSQETGYGGGIQSDGRMLYWKSGGTPNSYIVGRLNSDGSPDTGFTTGITTSSPLLTMGANDQFAVPGSLLSLMFSNYTGFLNNYSRDGGLAEGGQYFYTGRPNQPTWVNFVAPLDGGGYAIGGQLGPNYYFTAAPTNGAVSSALGQADGKLLIAGSFTQVGNTVVAGIARTDSSGSVDPGFIGANAKTFLTMQEDGKVLVFTQGGSFQRLLNTPATQSLSATSSSRVQWLRGGSSPAALGVTFDVSTDGGSNWTKLGNGTFMPAARGWELNGLNLPASGILRARARIAGVYNKLGVVESRAAFGINASPEIVIEQTPGTALVSGSGVPFQFGPVAAGNSASLTFTIRNTGFGDLTGLALSRVTPAGMPGDFTITGPAVTSLAHDASATFTVAFTPVAAGNHSLILTLASNDADESAFVLSFEGSLATQSELWRKQNFDTFSNTGTAADLADPDGDGIPNLLEFATGSNPLAKNPATGTLVKNGGVLEFTWSRLKATTAELTCRVEWSETPDGIWRVAGVSEPVVVSDDGVTQVMKSEVPPGTTGRRFVRLKVLRN